MDMSVYLDTLVIVNTYIGWLIISLCARLAHLGASGKRRAAGAFLSGLTSLIIVMPSGTPFLKLAAAMLKLISCPLIAFAAFYKKGMSLKRYLFSTLCLTMSTMALGGAVYLIQMTMSTDIIYINNYSFYFDISLSTLIFLTGLVYIIMLILSHFFSRESDEARSYTVGFTVRDKSYILEGISDTGNTVTDLFSGKRVVICQGFEHPPPSSYGMRVVPYSTVNGEGILYAFSPDSIYIENDAGQRKDVSALVAFVEGGKKRAVFNPKILM